MEASRGLFTLAEAEQVQAPYDTPIDRHICQNPNTSDMFQNPNNERTTRTPPAPLPLALVVVVMRVLLCVGAPAQPFSNIFVCLVCLCVCRFVMCFCVWLWCFCV